MSKLEPRRALRPVAAGMTDVGRQRRHNEDHVLVSPELALFVVADGMGGHNAGHVASALTATSMQNFFEATQHAPIPIKIQDDERDLAPAAQRLTAAVRKANRDVWEISQTHKEHRGMGSTVVALHWDGERLHVAHVGDSRCYRIRDGEIKQVTRDHSLINDALAIKPDLTDEELARLPKNVITRALGMKENVKVDAQSIEVEPGDIYLLCSDGLSGMISNHQILEVFDLTEDMREASELLIAMANDAGGVDNISALLVRIDDAPESAPAISTAPGSITTPYVDVGEEAVLSQPIPELYGEYGDAGAEEAPVPSLPIVPVAGSAEKVPSLRPEPVAEVVAEEVVVSPIEQLRDLMSPEELAMLEAGGELEISPAPRPAIDEIEAARCRTCGHELYMGNVFCTECGARIG